MKSMMAMSKMWETRTIARRCSSLVSAILPRHVAPVVRERADSEREIVVMSWGFMLLQKERAPTGHQRAG